MKDWALDPLYSPVQLEKLWRRRRESNSHEADRQSAALPMSHVGMVPTGENPSAGSSQRKPPAVRIDESAVVPGIRFRPVRIASRRTRSGSKGAHLLERTTGIEPVTSILARSRSDGSPAQWAGEQKTLPSPLRIPPELCPQTTTLAANARVASPARPHA